MKKFVSLALVLVMLLGTLPMALATGAECSHAETETIYEPNNDGTHWETVLCKAENCTATDNKVSDVLVDCTNTDFDTECDKCHADILGEERPCYHDNVETAYTANNDGTHVKTVTCKSGCGATDQATMSCVDNGEGVCNLCGASMKTTVTGPAIECSADGTQTLAKSAPVTFTLLGVEANDVSWSFSVAGSAAPTLSTTAAAGMTASVEVTAGDDRGVAQVTATATWSGGAESLSETVSLSFFTMESYTLKVKDGETGFSFTETGVFEKVSGNFQSVKAETFSLIQALTDGYADRVILSEDSNANAKVGVITYNTTGKFLQYDPEDENDYAITELDNLSFAVLGEGKYKLQYELYEQGSGYNLVTTKGSLNIEVGDTTEAGMDIVYHTAGDVVSFRLQDFVDYWEDHAKTQDNEPLEYVKFEISDEYEGLLYLDKTQRGIVHSTHKFMAEYENRANTYPLDGVTYKPNPKLENYTDQIGFVAYGDGGSSTVIRGTVTIIVGEQVPFTDVSEDDWFYKEVRYVYEKGIMRGNDTSGTIFAPNSTLTRGMVVTMLHRMEQEPAVDQSNTFSDVAADQWYTQAVEWAAKNNIVTGFDGKFEPMKDITRQDLAAILYRYAKYKRMDVSAGGTNLKGFSDESKVASYAVDAMIWAVRAKIINGDGGKLMPQGNATRAQAAAMLYRFLEPETEE